MFDEVDFIDVENSSVSESSADLVNDILSGVADIIGSVSGSEEEQVPPQIIIFNTESGAQEAEPAPEIVVDEPEDVWIYDEEYGLQVYAVAPITSANGLKGLLLDVIGPYDGIVVEYRYQNANNTSYSYVRDIQLDYPWLCSAAIFLALLWSVFSIGGRLICRK